MITPLLTKAWFPYLIAAIALCLLAVVSISLWSEGRERFPQLPRGSYLGAVNGIFSEEGGKAVRFYVEVTPQSDDLFFLLLRPGWQPQIISMSSPGASLKEEQWYFPLKVNGGGVSLKLTGSRTEGGYYAGAAFDMLHETKGDWWLRPVRDGSEETKRRESEVGIWLGLKTELEDTEAGIGAAEKRAPELKAEIEKLTDFVTEGQALRQKADRKFATVREELRTAHDKFKLRQQAAQQLESRIELSQRVTAMGKLVSLSRESLEREARWFDSMINSSPSASVADVDAAVEKGLKIMDLKKAIALEEERLARLQSHARDALEAAR